MSSRLFGGACRELVVHVLVIEPDSSFRQFLRRSIESDGHTVVAVARHEEGVSAVAGGNVDAVLVGLEPGNTDVADAVREIRAAAGNTPLQALLFSAFYEADDPELRVLLRLFTRAQFLPKPFTTADLRDRLGRLIGGGPITLGPVASGPFARPPIGSSGTLVNEPPRVSTAHAHEEMPTLAPPRVAAPVRIDGARPARPPDLRNALMLMKIWATRATGVAALNGGPDDVHGWATVARGGPADPESKALLEAALYGGEFTFEATQVNAQGDWDALGNLLFHGLRDPSQGRFAQENRFQALHRTNATHLALHVPIGPETRRLLARADGQTTLGEQLAREGIEAANVSVDLHVLRLLRMVEVQAPLPAQPPQAPQGEVAPVARPASSMHSSTTTGGALRRPLSGSPLPSSPVSVQARSLGSGSDGPRAGGGSAVIAAPRAVGSTGQGLSTGHGAQSSPPPPSVRTVLPARSGPPSHGGVPRAARGPVSQGATPSATATATPSALGISHGRGQISQALLRLRREEHDLREAAPAVVLGVPTTAEAELVKQAADRMRQRYAAMSRDESLPVEGRTLAAQILSRIDESERGFARARSAAVTKVDEEMLLKFAREQIGRRNWEQAEKALRKARQMRSDHPAVLANLGWVILSNPSRPAEARTEEARELLLLSEQFDPHNADGQHYLAELLYRLGEYAAALPRAERAIKAQPDHAAAMALARRLRAKLTTGN